MDASVEPTDEEYQPLPSLIPCSLCNRKFLPESLLRHKKACEKVLMKKRKQFDSAKQRLTGELAECLPLPPAKLKRPSPVKKSSRWKEKHLELLETLRAARVGSSGGPSPLLAKPSDHEQCPHCGRSFGPKAFDRHVEYCKEKFARLENQRPSVSLQAKERLEARIKYRAPCIKSRRSITREKYLPPSKREPSPGSNSTGPGAPTLPTVNRTESKPALVKQNSLSNTKENDHKATPTSSNFVRGTKTSSFRSSQRRPSKQHTSSSITTGSKVTPAPAQSTPKQPLAPKPANNQALETPTIRQTLHALPASMKIKKDLINSREEKYDPFASAEQQMKELLSFSLKTEKIEPSYHKPIFLKALPLPYYDTINPPPPPAEDPDSSQNKSNCSMDSFLSKSGSQNSLDQSIVSLENFLNESNTSIDKLLDQCNGNVRSPVKTTRTKSVDYPAATPGSGGPGEYIMRSKSVTTPGDPGLARVIVNFDQNTVSPAALGSESSGSKRSTLCSPDLLERPGSRPGSRNTHDRSVDNLSDISHHSDAPGRKSASLCPPDGNGQTVKCASPFDQLRSAPNASLESILGRKNSLEDFTHEELMARLSQSSSRKSSVCSDCSQVISSRKNSSAGFLPDIARCGAKEPVVSRDNNGVDRRSNSSNRDSSGSNRNSNASDRNINRNSNSSTLSLSSGEELHTRGGRSRVSSGEEPQGRGIRSGGSLEPLRRSTSLFEPSGMRHPARHKPRGKQSLDETPTLPKLDMNRNGSVTTLGDRNGSVPTLADEKSLDMVEQELLESVSEFEKIFDLSSSLYSSPYANSTLQEDSVLFGPRSGSGVGNKAAGDSAYNSLNRKSQATDHTSSSSGSESSFPNQSDPNRGGTKLSKFCHECGTQYPLTTAKFCCQCGVRRLCLA